MRLFLYELKKLLLTEKGLWILLGAALLSAALMFFFPEQRDARIVHAHKKYDEYMSRYYGPDTEEKQTEIRTRAEEVLSILGSFVENRTAYQNGKMTEDEWSAYIRAYELALQEEAASDIFFEKAERFKRWSEAGVVPDYMDEYGWETSFFLTGFPAVFSLIALVLIASRSMPMEFETGLFPVLYASAKGRRELKAAKLLAVTVSAFSLGLVTGALDLLAFSARGFLNDPGTVSASVKWFAEAAEGQRPLIFSLLMAELLRLLGLLLTAILSYSLSVFLKNSRTVILLMLALLFIPLLLLLTGNDGLLMGLTGLLSGSRLLRRGQSVCLMNAGITTAVCMLPALIAVLKRAPEKQLVNLK